VLAHLYLEDGVNINALLVEQGHAAAIAFPPNLGLLKCYGHAEQIARQNQRGIWSTDFFRPIPTTRLATDSKGFRLLTGEVRKISHTPGQGTGTPGQGTGTPGHTHSGAPVPPVCTGGCRSIWITLDGEFALRVAKKDLEYFESVNFDQYVGRKIIARGWVYPYRGKPVMQIRHPFSLQLIQ